MAEQPPVCFLGWSNVRSWTLGISIINTVTMLMIFISRVYTKIINYNPDDTLNVRLSYYTIIAGSAFLIILNMSLSFAVFKRNYTIMRIWLWTYTAWYIFWGIMVAIVLFDIAFLEKDGKRYSNEDIWFLIIFNLIYYPISLLFQYTVYQYYKFEKRSQGSGAPGLSI